VWIVAIGASVVAALACMPIDERSLRPPVPSREASA
jgi:hypothetical protein